LSTKETDFEQRLKRLVYQSGGDLFGVSDLTPARKFIIAQGGETLNKFLRAISIAIRLSDVKKREDSVYLHHIYEVVNPELNFLARRVCGELQAKGYQAFPVPASMPYNKEALRGIFSHKLAAHLAGLGWIGKNCLFITHEFGPRVRLVTILTDAPLSSGKPLDKECGKCQTCIDTCPIKAFTGIEFRPGDSVETRFNVRACAEYRRTHPCGMCMAICPVGHHNRLNRTF
jgi:epoxyqueuosine reductase QueG